mmetsp:Transcript_14398/g.26989  ORF Transcript_14398/g.26989 Transcript_14398/m.26989 type:complete len:248 (+) Transcript_14398:74-817(+)
MVDSAESDEHNTKQNHLPQNQETQQQTAERWDIKVLSHPGNVLLLSSIPFFAGAFLGYKIPIEQFEDLSAGGSASPKSPCQSSTSTNSLSSAKQTRPIPSTTTTSASCNANEALTAVALNDMNPDEARVLATRMAVRAFRVATLGTLATFGLVGAAGFYASGCRSVEEAIQSTRAWASSWRKSLQHILGTDKAVSKNHPDVIATKNMTGEEEMDYLWKKYMVDDTRTEPTPTTQSPKNTQEDKSSSS